MTSKAEVVKNVSEVNNIQRTEERKETEQHLLKEQLPPINELKESPTAQMKPLEIPGSPESDNIHKT